MLASLKNLVGGRAKTVRNRLGGSASRPARRAGHKARPCLGIELLEGRTLMSGTPITGLAVIEQGTTNTTLFSNNALVSQIDKLLNGLAAAVQSSATQGLQQQVQAKLPGGWSVAGDSVLLPKMMTSANTAILATINANQSVSLDVRISGVTGTMTISPSAFELGVAGGIWGAATIPPFGAIGAAAGAIAALTLPKPAFNFTTTIDMTINLPDPKTLAQLSTASSFALPSQPTVQANNIAVSAQSGNVLAGVGQLANQLFGIFPKTEPITISPANMSTIVAALNAAFTPVASALETAVKDAGVFSVVNKGGVLDYNANTMHSFSVAENSLVAHFPSVAGTFAPVTAQAHVFINSLTPSQVLTSPPTFSVMTAAAPRSGIVPVTIDVFNHIPTIVLQSGALSQVGGQWQVKWKSGQVDQLFNLGGNWAVKRPDGTTLNTGVSVSFSPAILPVTTWTQLEQAPTGTQLATRVLNLNFNVSTGAISGTTSDGVSVSGQAGKAIAVLGGKAGYPDVSFTISMV